VWILLGTETNCRFRER